MKNLSELLAEVEPEFDGKKVKTERDELYDQSAVYDKESFYEGALFQYTIDRASYDRLKVIAVGLAKHYEIMLDWIERNHEMPNYSEMIANAKRELTTARKMLGEK